VLHSLRAILLFERVTHIGAKILYHYVSHYKFNLQNYRINLVLEINEILKYSFNLKI
jgi:hypothetical protein